VRPHGTVQGFDRNVPFLRRLPIIIVLLLTRRQRQQDAVRLPAIDGFSRSIQLRGENGIKVRTHPRFLYGKEAVAVGSVTVLHFYFQFPHQGLT
jgi:hypothetical protein